MDLDQVKSYNEDVAKLREQRDADYAEYEKDGVTYKVWLEDAQSLEKKLQVMQELNLAGGAFWKSGMETADVWDTINSYIK